MNFMEKLNLLKKVYEELDIYLSFPEKGTSSNEIAQLKNYYAFIPKDYEKFLKEYDGLHISWCTLIGSDSAKFANRSKIIPFWQKVIDEKYVPIAKNAQGDLFAIKLENEAIMLFDAHTEKTEFIATSFSEFMSDCVLGKRYGEFAYIENNPFYDFLKEQGWV